MRPRNHLAYSSARVCCHAPCRSFTSKVHKPATMYWIYYGSPDATLIRMVKTMLGVVFNDVGKMLGFRKKRHTAWSNKRKQQAAAKSL